MPTPSSTPVAKDPSGPKPEKPIDFRPAKKAIDHQHLELRISDTLTERYSLVYLPPSNPLSTACWHYERGDKRGQSRHIITFGANLANNKREGADLGDYAKAYHRHELAHSLWTERDLPALNTACAAAGVPFQLLNLFEDARIEHKWRETFEERFEWSHFEQVKPVPATGEPADRAASAMMAMIQCEGDDALLADVLKEVPEAAEVRTQFYDKAVAASNARALIPLMEAFVRKYGAPKKLQEENPKPGEGDGRATAGDMSAGLKVASDASRRSALIKAEKAETGGDATQAPDVGAPGGVGERSEFSGITKGGVLCDEASGEINPKVVERLTQIFHGVFRTGPMRYKRETPSKRLSVRDLVLDRTKIYRAIQHAAPFRSRIAVVFDCSGSMAGVPLEGGRHLVCALGELARRNVIEGDLILSAIITDRASARNQRIPLREVTDEIAERIGAYGAGEGLAPAFNANKACLTEADCTLVYTDGNITDAPIDRAAWHRRGVFTLGCYVGDADSAPRLREWFDAPLCRSKIENLAHAIAAAVKNKAAIKSRAYCEPREQAGAVTRAVEVAGGEATEVRTGSSPRV